MKAVLYVEDNPADVEAARQALAEIGAPIVLYPVENAVQAFLFLARRAEFRHVPKPDAIVIDLHLPIMSGLVVLQELKNDPLWCHLPAIVFSISQQAADRREVERLGSMFVAKPSSWQEHLALARRLWTCMESGDRPAAAAAPG